MESPADLQATYEHRFSGAEGYRRAVWGALCQDFFQSWVPTGGAVLDLGCGYGEFITQIVARYRYGMDLNPESSRALAGSGSQS